MSKHLYFVLIFITFSCSEKEQKKHIDNVAQKNKRNVYAEVKSFYLGDVNNDNKEDFGKISQYYFNDNSKTLECANKNCEITIDFSETLPDLVIKQTTGCSLSKLEDLNNDNSNEILILVQGFDNRGDLIVYTLKDNNWNELARTKVILSQPLDWSNRVIKDKNDFYILGDSLDSSNRVLVKSARTKIKK